MDVYKEWLPKQFRQPFIIKRIPKKHRCFPGMYSGQKPIR